MPSIIELSEEKQNLIDTLFFADVDDDSENDIIKARLDAIQGTAKQKLSYLSTVLVEIKLNESARKEARDKAQKRYQTAVNAESKLREYIKETMLEFGISKIEGEYANLGIQKGRETVFIPDTFDASQLPQELFKYTPESFEPRRVDITRILKEGTDVCGLELLRGDQILSIR